MSRGVLLHTRFASKGRGVGGPWRRDEDAEQLMELRSSRKLRREVMLDFSAEDVTSGVGLDAPGPGVESHGNVSQEADATSTPRRDDAATVDERRTMSRTTVTMPSGDGATATLQGWEGGRTWDPRSVLRDTEVRVVRRGQYIH